MTRSLWSRGIKFINDILATWYGRVLAFALYCFLVHLYLFSTDESGAGFWGRLADGIGIISAVFAFLASALNFENNRQKQKRDMDAITVMLQNISTGDRCKLPITLRRGDVSRSEVLGYLGLLPLIKEGGSKSKPRFDIDVNQEFMDAIYKLQDNEERELIIDLQPVEFDKIDRERLRPDLIIRKAKDIPETAQN